MTNAALTACRMIADEVHGCKTKGYMVEVLTAKEMALTPHNLRKGGFVADCLDGRHFGWSSRLEMWVRFGNE